MSLTLSKAKDVPVGASVYLRGRAIKVTDKVGNRICLGKSYWVLGGQKVWWNEEAYNFLRSQDRVGCGRTG